MTAHRWLIAAAAHAAFRRLALRGPLRLSLVARPPPTSCAWSSPPARSCATSNSSVARPPARPPSPPARLRPSIHLARGRQVSTRPPPSHSPPPRCTARPLSPARRTERPIWAGNAAATGWWRPRQRGSATPRKLARQTCDLCPSYSPQILPYPGSPGTASGEPRQVCSISDKFIPPERRSSAAWRPRTGLGTGQVWILHGAAVYLRAHGAFRGAPEACRLRGAAIARRRRLCQLTVTPSTRSQCVCSASTPATVTPSVLAYTG